MPSSFVTHLQQKIFGTPKYKIKYALALLSLKNDRFIYMTYLDNWSKKPRYKET